MGQAATAMSSLTLEVSLREGMESDLPLIYNSWLLSHYNDSLYGSEMKKTVYMQNHKHILTRILDASRTLVACSPVEPSQVFGYAVYTINAGVLVIHYMFVKGMYRKMGVGGTLFYRLQNASEPGLPVTITHTTKAITKSDPGESLEKKWNLVYNPYMLERLIR